MNILENHVQILLKELITIFSKFKGERYPMYSMIL